MTVNIEKLLNRDKERLIQAALKAATKDYVYIMDLDEDKSEAYFEMYRDGSYKVYSIGYTIDESGASATINGEAQEVVMQSEYKPITKSYLDKKLEEFASVFGGTKREAPEVEKGSNMVIKKYNDEEMIAYEPLYCPPETDDGAEERMTEAEIIKMVDNLNENIQAGKQLENLGHKVPITKAWKYQEAFVSPWPECVVVDDEGTETTVTKGQSVLVVKYNNERAWELRKEGKIKGPSIGANGKRVEQDD